MCVRGQIPQATVGPGAAGVPVNLLIRIRVRIVVMPTERFTRAWLNGARVKVTVDPLAGTGARVMTCILAGRADLRRDARGCATMSCILAAGGSSKSGLQRKPDLNQSYLIDIPFEV